MTNEPKFFTTDEHSDEPCVAIPVDVEGYGPGGDPGFANPTSTTTDTRRCLGRDLGETAT